MIRNETKNKIKSILKEYYQNSMISKVLRKQRFLSLSKRYEIENKYGLDIRIWDNITDYIDSQEQKRRENQACENDIKKSDINREKVELA